MQEQIAETDGLVQETAEDLETKVLEYAHFEELVHHLSSSNFEEAKSLIHKLDKLWVQKLIRYMVIYLNSQDSLIDFYPTEASYYFYARGLIGDNNFDPNKIKSVEEYEKDPIQENSIWHFIRNDDLDGFLDFSSSRPNISSSITLYNYIFNMPVFAAFCGSMKILNYFEQNHCFLGSEAKVVAVEGGNLEAVQLLSNRHDLSSNIGVAIQCHNNKVVKFSIVGHPKCIVMVH